MPKNDMLQVTIDGLIACVCRNTSLTVQRIKYELDMAGEVAMRESPISERTMIDLEHLTKMAQLLSQANADNQ
jgi:hypothetical protein